MLALAQVVRTGRFPCVLGIVPDCNPRIANAARQAFEGEK